MTGLRQQLAVVTALALLALGYFTYRDGSGAFLTPDQRGALLMRDKAFAEAALTFTDPLWAGQAHYAAGEYEEAASAYSQLPTYVGHFNRGAAMMKAFNWDAAIDAFGEAVALAPTWQDAQDNLELATYARDYIEEAREQSDTGDESELSADDYAFDNRNNRGRDMTIRRETLVAAQSEDKWMRSVNTDTRDFLRSRFALEVARDAAGVSP